MKQLLIITVLLLLTAPASAQEKPFKPSKSQLRAEYWHYVHLQRPIDEARRRLNAAQSDLDLFLSAPPDKRLPEPSHSQLIADQRGLVKKYAAELEVAQRDLAVFNRMLADNGARAVFHKQLKERAKAEVQASRDSYTTYRSPRISITIRCYSYSTRYSQTTRCVVY